MSDDTRRVAQASRKRLQLFSLRPQPPRGVKISDGQLRWEEPREKRNVTQYRVYAPDDGVLFSAVPVGSRGLNGLLPNATKVYVSSFNEESGLESPRIEASEAARTPGSFKAGDAPPLSGQVYEFDREGDGDTGEMFRFTGSWVEPEGKEDLKNFSGVRVIAKRASDTSWLLLARREPGEVDYIATWMPVPDTDETWTLKYQPLNADGVPWEDCPSGSVMILKGKNGLDLTKVLAGSYSAVHFGLVGGKFAVAAVDMELAFNVDLNQFNVTGGFRVKALAADLINTGKLKVGGTGIAGQVVVVDSDNTSLIAWVGKTDDGAYRGGYFSRLWVGGTDPSNARFTVMNNVLQMKGMSINVGPGVDGDGGAIFAYTAGAIHGFIGSGDYPGAVPVSIASTSSNQITFSSTHSFLVGHLIKVFGNSAASNNSVYKVLSTPTSSTVLVERTLQAGTGGEAWRQMSGAWFRECRIAGNDPLSAKIVADENGILTIDGSAIISGSLSVAVLSIGTMPLGGGGLGIEFSSYGLKMLNGASILINPGDITSTSIYSLNPATGAGWSLSSSGVSFHATLDYVGIGGDINATSYQVDGVEVINSSKTLLNIFDIFMSGWFYMDGVPVLTGRGPEMVYPSGGTVIDSQARTAITILAQSLEAMGLITGPLNP
jgi:hypothetical protein